jgi:hypothetical protein
MDRMRPIFGRAFWRHACTRAFIIAAMAGFVADSQTISDMSRPEVKCLRHTVLRQNYDGGYLRCARQEGFFLLSLVTRLRGGMERGNDLHHQSNNGKFYRSGNKKGWSGGSKRWKGSSRFNNFHKRRAGSWKAESEANDGNAIRWGKWGGLHEPPNEEQQEEESSSTSSSAWPSSQDQQSSVIQGNSSSEGKQASSLGASGTVVASSMPLHHAQKRMICKQVAPLASRPEDVDGEALKKTLQEVFGYNEFRGRQEEVVRRVLCGLSTIFVSATGSGKSLCYLVPAAMTQGIVIVISPLIALIQDQIKNLPPSLRGAAMHSMLTQAQNARVLAEVQAGKVKILFLSPERLFSDSFLSLAALLPPISFVCVDEVRDPHVCFGSPRALVCIAKHY